MKKYWVTPIQQNSWKYVLIYDEPNDIFYTAPRDVAGTLDQKMYKILVVLFSLCMVSNCFFDSFIRLHLWNNYTYTILVIITILFSCINSKHYFQKLSASMAFSRYEDKNLTLARGMFTLDQRQQYFTRMKPKRRSLTMIVMAAIFFVGDFSLSAALLNNYSTIMLFMVLFGIYTVILTLYSAMFFFKDSDMQYLSKKFASKT